MWERKKSCHQKVNCSTCFCVSFFSFFSFLFSFVVVFSIYICLLRLYKVDLPKPHLHNTELCLSAFGYSTIQLYCLCVEKFAFWLVVYIKIEISSPLHEWTGNKTNPEIEKSDKRRRNKWKVKIKAYCWPTEGTVRSAPFQLRKRRSTLFEPI